MTVPRKETWRRIAKEFYSGWNFPNLCGSLDGKHIVIQAPAKSGSLFFNYKKTFSIVLVALVDANYRFIAVDIGSYGRQSDGCTLKNSILGQKLEKNELDLQKTLIYLTQARKFRLLSWEMKHLSCART